MKPRLLSFFLLSFLFQVTIGPAPARAQRWTLSADVQEQVDGVFSFVERDAPGCALGVIQGGKLAYGSGYGLANLDWGIPITTSTVFDIGSVSKQFTATALALLELDGVLSLDDEVRKWIPELPDYGTPFTIRHLLTHTSGVRDYLTLMSLAGIDYDNVFDEFDGVEIITRQKGLNFEPGSEYLYSNSGYLLLANIVRRATGKSLRTFLEERVFDPLGMSGTSVWDDNTEILSERATGYAPADGGWEIDHAWNFQMGGDGQVITSVDDLLQWDGNFYEPAVGGQGLLDRLHTRGILTSGDTIAYALGLSVGEYRGLRRVEHGGSWAGFRAQLTRYPDQRTSIVVLCNRADASPGAYAREVAEAVLAQGFPELPPEPRRMEREAAPEAREAEEAAPPQPTPAELRMYAGRYYSEELDTTFEVALDAGELWLHRPGRDPSRLRFGGTNQFQGGGLRLTFLRDGGRVLGLRIFAGRVTGIEFLRQAG